MARTPKKAVKTSELSHLTYNDVKLIRKILKEKLLSPNSHVLRDSQSEFDDIFSLFRRAMEHGESNSALLIGPRGSGKTILINSVIKALEENCKMFHESIIVQLNGYVHTDDRLALKSIATQLQLDNTLGDKVFGSFAENLAFLLQCLKEGDRDQSKSVIFILDEFDLFCHHQNQTLLYNLFDVAQSAQAPICVLGVTCRKDVTDLLEKRVMSRFSNRQIHLYPHAAESFEGGVQKRLILCKELLSISKEEEIAFSLNVSISCYWNSLVDILCSNEVVIDCMKQLFAFSVCERTVRNFLLLVVSRLDDDHRELTFRDFTEVSKLMCRNLRVAMIEGLSVLELCLLIAMMHQNEIFDCSPFNFEMVFARLSKFNQQSSKVMNVDRQVVVKAFEHLKSLEFLRPVTSSTQALREFQMFHLMLVTEEIREAVNNYQGLPTEVSQWAHSDFT